MQTEILPSGSLHGVNARKALAWLQPRDNLEIEMGSPLDAYTKKTPCSYEQQVVRRVSEVVYWRRGRDKNGDPIAGWRCVDCGIIEGYRHWPLCKSAAGKVTPSPMRLLKPKRRLTGIKIEEAITAAEVADIARSILAGDEGEEPC